MKKITFNYKKWTLLGIGAALTVTPLAVAVSCGSSKSSSEPAKPSQETYRDKFVTNISKFKFDLSSTDGNVKATVPALDPIAKSYKYLVGNYATLADAKSAPASAWVSTLPTTVDYIHANRHLYLQVETKTETELAGLKDVSASDLTSFSGDNKYFDLTDSSSIQDIKSIVDNVDGFTTLTLANVALTGTLEAPVITTNNITLPTGVVLKFFSNGNWITGPELIDYIKKNRDILNARSFNDLKVKLTSVDANRFVINDAKEIKVTTISIPFAPLTLDTLANALRKLTPTADSNNQKVTWLNGSDVELNRPDAVDSVTYYAGPAATEAELIALGSQAIFTNDLPTTLDANHGARNLWAKYTPVTGQTLTTTFVNLTTSSKVREVLTLLSTPEAAISNIKLTGTLDSPVIDLNGLATPANLALNYQVGTSAWLEQQAFIEYIKTSSSGASPLITYANVKNAKARFVVLNPTLYIISDNREGQISVNMGVPFTTPASLITALNNIKVNATSTSATTTWSGLSAAQAAKPSQITKIVFYYGSEATIDDVRVAAPSGSAKWIETLPTTVDFVHESRNLYARLIAADGTIIANDIINLTTSSGIQSVLSSIPTENINLATIILYGTRDQLKLSTKTVAIPDHAEIRYQINNGPWLIGTDLITDIQSDPTKYSDANIKAIKARLQVIDATKYVITNSREATIIVPLTPLEPYTVELSSTFGQALVNIKVAANSKIAALNWSGLSAAQAALPSAVSGIEFYSGPLSLVDATTNGVFSVDLPTATDASSSTRNLYVRFKAADGFIVSPALLDLTGSSNIRTFTPSQTVIDTSAVNLSAITLGGQTDAPTINLNNLVIPTNTDLRFKIGSSSWLNEANFKAYIIAYAATLTNAELAAPRVRLEAASADYSVVDSRETAIASTITRPTPPATVVDTSGVDLSIVTIGGTTANPIVNLSGVVVPTGAVIKYKIGASSWLDEAALKAYIIANANNLTTENIDRTFARLEAASTAYSVVEKRERAITNLITSTATPINIPAALITALNAIRPTANSTHSSVGWTGLTDIAATLPAQIAAVTFYSGVFGINDVKFSIAASWETTLPEIVNSNQSARTLFARLTPATGYTITNYLIDITASSKVREIPTILSTSTYDLTKITLGGTKAAPTITTNNNFSTEGIRLEYRVGTSGWLTQENFLTYITNNAATLTSADLDGAQARLVPSSALYVLSSDGLAYILNTINKIAAPASIESAVANIKFTAASRQNSVMIDTNSLSAVTSQPNFASLQYYYGSETTTYQVRTSNVAWLNAVPTIINENASARNLFVRFVPTSGIEYIGGGIYDITNSSGIRNIPTVIDSSGADLSKIKITGSGNIITVDESQVAIPAHTVIRYKVGAESETYLSADEIVTAVRKGGIPLNILNNTFAKLIIIGQPYELTSNPEVAVTVEVTPA